MDGLGQNGCTRGDNPANQVVPSGHEGKGPPGGKTVGAIKVQNGLRQGCCMAPVLFNLYTCLAVGRSLERVEGVEGVGIIKYKVDGKLFRCYTRNARDGKITECEFADDSTLLAPKTVGAEMWH